MCLDGLFAEEEPLGDLAVGEARGDEFGDLALTVAECGDAGARQLGACWAAAEAAQLARGLVAVGLGAAARERGMGVLEMLDCVLAAAG